jgi:hypothetical protein
MPRQRKPPPVILSLESLSTGAPLDPNGPMVDDFTGEPIVRVWPQTTSLSVPQAAQEIIDTRNNSTAKIRRIVLKRVGIVKD